MRELYEVHITPMEASNGTTRRARHMPWDPSDKHNLDLPSGCMTYTTSNGDVVLEMSRLLEVHDLMFITKGWSMKSYWEEEARDIRLFLAVQKQNQLFDREGVFLVTEPLFFL